jgi:hypothetical protein
LHLNRPLLPTPLLSLLLTLLHRLLTLLPVSRQLKRRAAVMRFCLLSPQHLPRNRLLRKLAVHCRVLRWQVRAVGCTRCCDRVAWLKSHPAPRC